MLVVFMQAAATALGSLLFVRLAAAPYFTADHQLRRFLLLPARIRGSVRPLVAEVAADQGALGEEDPLSLGSPCAPGPFVARERPIDRESREHRSLQPGAVTGLTGSARSAAAPEDRLVIAYPDGSFTGCMPCGPFMSPSASKFPWKALMGKLALP
jgi:hypothetical protein